MADERGHAWLEGEVYAELLPRLDGRAAVGEVVAGLKAPPAEAFLALVLLADAGYLAGGDAPCEPRLDAKTLEDLRSRVLERLGAERLGAERREDSPLLVVVDDESSSSLAALGDAMRRRGRGWLLVRPLGVRPRLGPVFAAGGPCPRCLRRRLELNRPLERGLGLEVPRPWSRRSVDWTLELAAEVASRGAAGLEGRLASLDLETGALGLHPVDPWPGCCAESSPAAPRRGEAVRLESRPRLADADGGHRSEDVRITLERLRRLVSPVTGLVRDLRRLPVDGAGKRSTFVAAHAYPGRSDDPAKLRHRLRQRCAGKGRTALQAEVSALGEAVERYAGFHRRGDSCVTASFRHLEEEGARPLRPNEVMLFSRRQFAEREAWNARQGHANWVPEPFQDEEPVDWTPLWSLRDEAVRHLPTAALFFDPLPGPSPYCRADSNGNAAGGHLEDAILQGFLELVERDAVALWWYSRAPRPEWPLPAAPLAAELLRHLEARGRELWLLDLTSDLGIPVVAALSRHRDRKAGDLLMGFGAHLEPRLAAERALAELCQFLPRAAAMDSQESGAVGPAAGSPAAGSPAAGSPAAGSPMASRLLDHPAGELDWLVPSTRARPSPRRPDLVSGDVAAEVRAVVEVAASHGLDTLVLRQTRPETPLEVVEVVVPGLRPWWARFAPGRLFTAPVELDWTSSPPAEETLNPLHLCL